MPTRKVFGTTEFQRWVHVVLHARCSRDLLTGNVRLPNDRRRRKWGLSFDILNAQHDETIKHYIDLLKQVQNAQGIIPPRDRWAYNWANDLGIGLDVNQSQKLSGALDAAYTHLTAVCRDAQQKQYKPENHESDCVDYEQLFYLSDPYNYLLTADDRFRNKVSQSSQASQILRFKEFGKVASIF